MVLGSDPNISIQRQQFFEILAEYWGSYGLPKLSGYIDALLWLEKRDNWTQITISERLRELGYSTSVASVNRAIKINVQYGALIRKGSHKLGYTYHIADDTSMLEMMFQTLIKVNNKMIATLEDLRSSDIKTSDPELFNAVQMQYLGIKIYNESMEYGLEHLKNLMRSE